MQLPAKMTSAGNRNALGPGFDLLLVVLGVILCSLVMLLVEFVSATPFSSSLSE